MDQRIEALTGLRVLVAEDEPLIAMMLEEMLLDLGCEIAASCASLGEAVDACREGAFDVALVDMKLGNDTAHPVIAELTHRAIPYAIASGGDARAAIELRKPYGMDEVRDAMLALRNQLP